MPEEIDEGWLTLERARALVFAAIVAAVAYLCWLLIEPLMAPITVALALAVVAHPAHAWLLRRLNRKSLAAALTILLVAVVLVVPTTLAGRKATQEAVVAATKVQAAVKDGSWHQIIERYPSVAAAAAWLEGSVDLKDELGKLSQYVPKAMQAVMAGSVRLAIDIGVTLFLLFFFLRDREQILGAIRGLMPLSADEATQVFAQVDDTIYAIIFGTLVVALVQGALGAAMFWWLDLSAPYLWGGAMAVFSVVPMIGTAIIWGPAAVFLLVEGSPEKALLLAAWGFLVIGLVDNLLKPAIVQDRLRVHIVPVFVAILGGLLAFGPPGVIIGPVVLSVAVALIDIRRKRVRNGNAREPGAAHV